MTIRSQQRQLAGGLLLVAALLSTASKAMATEVQVGFSPEGSAEALVLQVIDKAHQQIRMMGYSFTSAPIVKALIAAHQRGVDVQIVLDAEGNKGHTNRAAMNLIANAGIPLRTDAAYKIQHDKVLITDGQNVETGSFNYTASAAKANSENALVLWDSPAVAQVYLGHFLSRWNQGEDYHAGY